MLFALFCLVSFFFNYSRCVVMLLCDTFHELLLAQYPILCVLLFQMNHLQYVYYNTIFALFSNSIWSVGVRFSLNKSNNSKSDWGFIFLHKSYLYLPGQACDGFDSTEKRKHFSFSHSTVSLGCETANGKALNYINRKMLHPDSRRIRTQCQNWFRFIPTRFLQTKFL